jgi:thiamine-monophosphate kinase
MSKGEFDLIREHFSPLATEPGAFQLTDDVAELGEFVLTKDMMIEGVHFLKSDPLDLIARKLLRVNISDLVCKGAKPVGYLLACAWPEAMKASAVAAFAKGLEEDQALFKISLFGGDTARQVAADAPMMLSATFLGQKPRAGIIRRNGAKAGDDLYVSGTIGDAGLGLAALQKTEKFAAGDKDFFVTRYRLPEPRATLGGALPGLASAAIDVSDGLLADAGHLAAMAKLRVEIHAEAIPISDASRRWRHKQDDRNAALARLAASGDDYEILFAAPPARRRAVEMAAKLSKTPVTRIGAFTKGAGVALMDEAGREIAVDRLGFDHFARD